VSGTAAARISGPITEPHQVDLCYASALHCHMHEVDEPCVPAFRWCLECGHTFATAGELLAEHNKILAAIGLPAETDADQVTCCAYCTHDW